MLSKANFSYYFYLALENAIYYDYITEKLWKHGFSHTVIPIVFMRKIVEPYAPPKSFIAVDDFETIEDLVNFLKRLMKDKAEYM